VEIQKPPTVEQEQRAWFTSDTVKFFQDHRCRPEDLYESEGYFLPDVLPVIHTVLDIGCAAGGFSQIMKAFNPTLEYTGIDINPEFLEAARCRYPDNRFICGNGIDFQTPPNSYDLVTIWGLLHLNSRWEDMIISAYTQARRFLLGDLRMTWDASVLGQFFPSFDGKTDDARRLPYVVINVDDAIGFLRALRPRPRTIRVRGYFHAPSSMARLPMAQVLMASVALEKADGAMDTAVSIDLPRSPAEGSSLK
jgi:SAM-dependent methyltransferase